MTVIILSELKFGFILDIAFINRYDVYVWYFEILANKIHCLANICL